MMNNDNKVLKTEAVMSLDWQVSCIQHLHTLQGKKNSECWDLVKAHKSPTEANEPFLTARSVSPRIFKMTGIYSEQWKLNWKCGFNSQRQVITHLFFALKAKMHNHLGCKNHTVMYFSLYLKALEGKTMTEKPLKLLCSIRTCIEKQHVSFFGSKNLPACSGWKIETREQLLVLTGREYNLNK